VVIAENSGAVTSMPNTNSIIFEVRRESPLPELLAECGYDVIQVGEAERLMPITEILTEQADAVHRIEIGEGVMLVGAREKILESQRLLLDRLVERGANSAP
jgi:hypothetical protein